jgi:hypothetical protein
VREGTGGAVGNARGAELATEANEVDVEAESRGRVQDLKHAILK